MFSTKALPLPPVPGGDHVEDSGETGQELGGTVASHLGPVVGPTLALQVAGGQEDSGGQVARPDRPVPGLQPDLITTSFTEVASKVFNISKLTIAPKKLKLGLEKLMTF